MTVLAKRDHFVVKQTFENGTKVTIYRKVCEFCFSRRTLSYAISESSVKF